MNEQRISLDVSKDGPLACVRVGQGDVTGTTITAEIYDGGEEIDLSGMTAYLVALLPDRAHYYRGACTVAGHAASCTVDEQELASIPGYTDVAYFTLTKSGRTYSTQRFAIDILPGALEDVEPSESHDSAIDELVARGEDAVEDALAASSTANAWASAAQSAALAAQGAADGLSGLFAHALAGITDLSGYAEAIDSLARRSCAGGFYLCATWYVKSDMVSWDGSALTVHGSRQSLGSMLLPSEGCSADLALLTAERADETSRESELALEEIQGRVATMEAAISGLVDAVDRLATNSYRYPFAIGKTMYVRGVSYASGALTMPTASLSDGKMLISAM